MARQEVSLMRFQHSQIVYHVIQPYRHILYHNSLHSFVGVLILFPLNNLQKTTKTIKTYWIILKPFPQSLTCNLPKATPRISGAHGDHRVVEVHAAQLVRQGHLGTALGQADHAALEMLDLHPSKGLLQMGPQQRVFSPCPSGELENITNGKDTKATVRLCMDTWTSYVEVSLSYISVPHVWSSETNQAKLNWNTTTKCQKDWLDM